MNSAPSADDLLTMASVHKNATELGVDPDLAIATAHQESGYKPGAVSPKGAQGVMQVMPATARTLTPKYGTDNIRQGVGYLKDMHDLYTDLPDEEKRQFALASYNAGPGRVASARRHAEKNGLDPNSFADVSTFLPGETRDYVPAIVKRIGQKSGQTALAVGENSPTADDLLNMAGSAKPAAREVEPLPEEPSADNPAEPQRGIGESLYDRTIGRVTRGVDAMTGHAVSDLAAYAGAKSAGDEAGAQEALTRNGGTANRLKDVALGSLETGATAAFPVLSAAQAGIGTGVEQATGSKGMGDVAEIATGIAPAVGKTLAAGARGVKSLVPGPSLRQEIETGLGAGTSAQEAGQALQAPGKGARAAVQQVHKEASQLYGEAQGAAKKAGLASEAKPLAKSARDAMIETRRAGGNIPSKGMAVLRALRKAGKGTTSPVLDAKGKAISTAAGPIPVDQLIEHQSTLRSTLGQMNYRNPGYDALKTVDSDLEAAIQSASAGELTTSKALGLARKRYAKTTIPTSKTAQRIIRAETPESAARQLTNPKQPTRFGRIARVAPAEAEGARSAHWTDAIDKATDPTTGHLDLTKLSSQLPKDPKALKQMADTTARRLTLKAVQRVAKVQKAAKTAPFVGSVVGGHGFGWLGLGPGYAAGKLVSAALNSEKVARALYHAARATEGTPGWQLATKALKKALGAVVPAVSAGAQAAQENG